MTEIAVVSLMDVSSQSSVEHERKVECKDENASITPQNHPKRKVGKKAATTLGKRALKSTEEIKVATQLTVIPNNIQTTTKKRTTKFKDPPASQLRIDSYFKSSSKSYKIEISSVKSEKSILTARGSKIAKTSQKVDRVRNKKIKGRKRLFIVGDNCSSTTVSPPSGFLNSMPTSKGTDLKRSTSTNATRSSNKPTKRKTKPYSLEELIDLCSDEDGAADLVTKKAFVSSSERNKSAVKEKFADAYEMNCLVSDYANNDLHFAAMVSIPIQKTSAKNASRDLKEMVYHRDSHSSSCSTNKILLQKKVNTPSSKCNNSNLDIKTEENVIIINKERTSSKSLVKASIVASDRVQVKQEPELLVASTSLSNLTKETNNKLNNLITGEKNDLQITPMEKPSTSKGKRVRKFRVCPPYKKVSGTTFAVDAFQYGQISGITHYFLTHFHADHYQGLTRKFEMPLYVSPITANLVRAFISVENKYINEIELRKPLMINDVEVTAIDANHCPGAVMFIFKLSTGRCIIHTGDFRASPDMESDPIFWNNDIDTIYLDTTYIAHKHNFASQYESIDRAKRIIREFHKKRPTTRVLYVCGSYVIGKERFWTNLAQEFNLKVWTEKNRLKALKSMDLDEVRGLLCDDPYKAEIHVISIAKVNYQSLLDYFRPFKQQYDALLAFRPSGWEKNSKPQLGGEINIVSIEYSEHSSQAELERFVTYLKPREVISTVPVIQSNPCITPKIPEKWYKYDNLKSRQRNFQPSITSFLKIRPRQLVQNASTKRNSYCVTPTRSPDYMPNELSQLSVSAMATCIEVQRDNKEAATSLKVPTVVTLFPRSDALEDWMS
nr:DNA cross-link repair protein PSO2/SNM1 isoform X2 [Bactrocera oleae]